MRISDIIKLLFRLLIGGMFITTAVAKLISIDQFELYIYSFNLFGYVFCTVVARLLIVFEFLVGIFLILKVYYRHVWWLMMLSLIGFSMFLVYVIIFRNDTNCHCFGELIELAPTDSLIKNILTMLLMLFIRKEEDYKLPHKKLVFYLTTAASIIVAFIVFPMDLLYNKFVSEKEHVNTVAFEEAKANAVFYNKLIIDDLHKNDSIVYREDSVSWDMNSGRYIMNIVASGCEFCKLGMKKVNMIFENNGIDKSRYKLAIWGTPITVSLFIKETEALDYDYHLISPVDAIDIVYGVFPTFLWVEDGKVVKAGNFREINENDIVDFLSKEE